MFTDLSASFRKLYQEVFENPQGNIIVISKVEESFKFSKYHLGARIALTQHQISARNFWSILDAVCNCALRSNKEYPMMP